jgi:hypothetical protein
MQNLFKIKDVWIVTSSPVLLMYSDNQWEASVELMKKLFLVFDIGPRSTCDSDFVDLYDVDTENNVETFRTRYCGEVSGGITCHIYQNCHCLSYSKHEITSHSRSSCHAVVESWRGAHLQSYSHTLLLLKSAGVTGNYFWMFLMVYSIKF